MQKRSQLFGGGGVSVRGEEADGEWEVGGGRMPDDRADGSERSGNPNFFSSDLLRHKARSK